MEGRRTGRPPRKDEGWAPPPRVARARLLMRLL